MEGGFDLVLYSFYGMSTQLQFGNSLSRTKLLAPLNKDCGSYMYRNEIDGQIQGHESIVLTCQLV